MRLYLSMLITLFTILPAFSQSPRIIKITDLITRTHNNTDTTYIINFWATWCAPCVKELPDFDSINNAYANKKVKVLLVTMDFKEDISTKVIPFIKNKKVKSEVMLLDETNGNYFIPKVFEEWSGALPATLIVNNKYNIKHFFEKKLNYDFLKTEIESINK